MEKVERGAEEGQDDVRIMLWRTNMNIFFRIGKKKHTNIDLKRARCDVT